MSVLEQSLYIQREALYFQVFVRLFLLSYSEYHTLMQEALIIDDINVDEAVQGVREIIGHLTAIFSDKMADDNAVRERLFRVSTSYFYYKLAEGKHIQPIEALYRAEASEHVSLSEINRAIGIVLALGAFECMANVDAVRLTKALGKDITDNKLESCERTRIINYCGQLSRFANAASNACCDMLDSKECTPEGLRPINIAQRTARILQLKFF